MPFALPRTEDPAASRQGGGNGPDEPQGGPGVVGEPYLMQLEALANGGLPPVALPRDELAHDVPVEWWYFAGHVADRNDPDERMSFMTTAIRGRKWLLPEGVVGFFKRTDHRRGPMGTLEHNALFDSAYRDRESPVRFDIQLGGSTESWTLEGAPARYTLRLAGEDGRSELALRLRSPFPAALLGDRGIVDYGGGHELAYYARSRLDAEGTAVFGGKERQVIGRGWYERQWGHWTREPNSWKYLSLELSEPGHQCLVFRAFNGPHRTERAWFLPGSGGIEPAAVHRMDDVAVAGEPVGTDLEIETSKGLLAVAVRPLFQEPEIRSALWMVPPFREDASTVVGTLNGSPARGFAMTEMHAYVG